MSSPRSRTLFVALSAILFAAAIPPSNANAQDPRDQRRDLLQGLLRSLIESKGPRPQNPPRPPQRNPQYQQLATELSGMSRQASALVQSLQVGMSSAPSSRYYLNDALKVQAESDVMLTRSRTAANLGQLQEPYRDLNRQWRTLAHRIEQDKRLPANCHKYAQAVGRHDAAICRLLEIQPQVDLTKLRHVCDVLEASFGGLVDAIEFEITDRSRRDALLLAARRAKQQAHLLGQVAERGPAQRITGEFTRLNELWSPLSSQIRPMKNRYLERSSRRIDDALRQGHELLWLPQPVNFAQLAQLATVLTEDVDKLFKSVTLDVLLDMRDGREVFNTASEFYGRCEHFSLAVSNREELVILAETFQGLEQTWPTLNRSFQNCNDQEVRRALRTVDASFHELGEALHIHGDHESHAAVEVVAALEILAEKYEIAFRRRVVANPNYAKNLRIQGARAIDQFKDEAAILHKSLLEQDRHVDHVDEHLARLVKIWRAIQALYVRGLTRQDQAQLNVYGAPITEHVVKLQTLISL